LEAYHAEVEPPLGALAGLTEKQYSQKKGHAEAK